MTTCANLGVVASLLIAATHQTTVGRPKPMEASVAFVEEFGERTGNQMLWATYAGALTPRLPPNPVIGLVDPNPNP